MRSKTNQNVSCSRLLKKGEQAPDTSPSVKNQFHIEAYIKLIRTDTTLNLSQKAEKRWEGLPGADARHWLGGGPTRC